MVVRRLLSLPLLPLHFFLLLPSTVNFNYLFIPMAIKLLQFFPKRRLLPRTTTHHRRGEPVRPTRAKYHHITQTIAARDGAWADQPWLMTQWRWWARLAGAPPHCSLEGPALAAQHRLASHRAFSLSLPLLSIPLGLRLCVVCVRLLDMEKSLSFTNRSTLVINEIKDIR